MATIATLETRLEANIIKFEEKMKRVDRLTDNVTGRIKRHHNAAANDVARTWARADLDSAFQRQIKSVDGLRSALMNMAPALAAAFSVKEAIAAADVYTRFTNALKVAGLEGERLAMVQDHLFASARQNGIAVEALGQLYGRMSGAAKDLGLNQESMLRLTDTVAAALKVQGTSAEQASGALLQLAQSMNGPKVQAEEYNSLLDGMPALLQAIADSSDKYGGSVGKLTQQVKAGNMTNQEWVGLILKANDLLEKRATTAALTFGQAMQGLQTALVEYIGKTDESLGVTERLAEGLKYLAENLDQVMSLIVIVGTGIAARMIVPMVQMGATALTTATAMGVLSRSMAFFGGPLGMTITAVGIALGVLADKSIKAKMATEEMRAKLDAKAEAAETAKKATDELRQAQGQLTPVEQTAAVKTATLTGEVDKLADANYRAAAMIKHRMLVEQRARVMEAKNDLETASRDLGRRERQVTNNIRGPIEPGSRGGAGGAAIGGADPQGIINRTVAATEEKKYQTQAQLEYNEALAEEKRLRDTLLSDPLFQPPKIPPPRTTGDGKPPKSRGSSGPTKEELAARREELDLQNQLTVAREAGDARRIQHLEDELELRRQIKAYEDAGATSAQAKQLAEDHMLKVWMARLQTLRNTVSEDQLVKPFKPGSDFVSSEDSQKEIAQRFQDQEDDMRESVRKAVRGGLEAAIEGGWPGIVEYMASTLRQRLMDNLVDVVANFLVPKGSGMTGGLGGIVGAIGSLFGGPRAVGGPVSPGRVYRINENGQEFFAPSVAGKMIPANSLGVPGGSIANQAPVFNFHTTVHADDAVMAGQIRQEIAQSHVQAIQAARQLVKVDMGRSQQNQLYRR